MNFDGAMYTESLNMTRQSMSDLTEIACESFGRTWAYYRLCSGGVKLEPTSTGMEVGCFPGL